MSYSDDDMLMLSGIQHYAYCPRQWALIHIDRQWEDNGLTVEGKLFHKRVDDPFYRQKCGDHICLRAVNIASYELGLYGVSDVVELHTTGDTGNSICHPKYPGRWKPFPIEYKHGKKKHDDTDEVQLAAQAMCLEEMYHVNIDDGAFFYGETRQRVIIHFDEQLRKRVRSLSEEMHDLMKNGMMPQVVKDSRCRRCSLNNICMPEVFSCATVKSYLDNNLYETTT